MSSPPIVCGTNSRGLKPLAIDPDRYGLVFPVFVGPTAMVAFRGVRYAMPPDAAEYPGDAHALSGSGPPRE